MLFSTCCLRLWLLVGLTVEGIFVPVLINTNADSGGGHSGTGNSATIAQQHTTLTPFFGYSPKMTTTQRSSLMINEDATTEHPRIAYPQNRAEEEASRLKLVSRNRQTGLNRLLSELLLDYNKEAAPSMPVEIDLKVLLIKVKNTIEREGIFECVVALFFDWQEPRFTWNPTRFNNITTLAFEPDRVWLPDIAMTNSADHPYAISKDTRFLVRVFHNGRSVFVPSGTSRTWCAFKLAAFPFDQQICSLDFESWTLESTSMVFHTNSSVLVDESADSNYFSTQWEVCSHRTSIRNITYVDSMGGTFQRISFTFNVHRKPAFYIVNLIFPIAMLSAVQLFIFFMPGINSASSRIAFGTTNLLTLVVFQTIVTAELPKTSDSVPALSQYIIALIIFTAYGTLESVIVERLLRMRERQTPPRWVRRLVERAWPNDYGVVRKSSKISNNQKQRASPSDEEDSGVAMTCHQKRSGRHRRATLAPSLSLFYRMIYGDGVSKQAPTEVPIEESHHSHESLNVVLEKCENGVQKPVVENHTVEEEQQNAPFYAKPSNTTNTKNAAYWADLAMILDYISFALCFCLAIAIPVVLFVPLLLDLDGDEHCNI